MKSYENIITNLFLLLTPVVLFGETAVMNPRSQGEGRKKQREALQTNKKSNQKRKHGENPCWQHHHSHKFITCIPWAETPASSTVLPSMPTRADLLPNSSRDEMKWKGFMSMVNCSPWPQHPHSHSRCSSKSALAAERRMGLEPGTWIQTSLLTQRKPH